MFVYGGILLYVGIGLRHISFGLIVIVIADEILNRVVGKKVLVEGTVVGVCAKRGCWINLSGDKEFEQIRIKVNDGEIVFPMEVKGKTATVEGEVYSVVIEGEGCGGDCTEEHKDEKEHNCEHKSSAKKVYMIKGLGAVIK